MEETTRLSREQDGGTRMAGHPLISGKAKVECWPWAAPTVAAVFISPFIPWRGLG